jgi:hypothetical protein
LIPVADRRYDQLVNGLVCTGQRDHSQLRLITPRFALIYGRSPKSSPSYPR